MAEIKSYHWEKLIAIAKELGVTYDALGSHADLREQMLERRAFMISEMATDGPCPECGAEWKPTSPGASSREIYHKDDCAYMNFYEGDGSN